MLMSSRGGGGSINADRWEGGGGKICQNLADVICERSLSETLCWWFGLKVTV